MQTNNYEEILRNCVGKRYCIVWNEPLQALASMSMHTKLNICVTTKQVTFPH